MRMWKNMVEPDSPHDNMPHALCMVDNWGCTHTHTHTLSLSLSLSPPPPISLSEYVTLFAFPQQQWFRECASVLRYTYLTCLVPIATYVLISAPTEGVCISLSCVTNIHPGVSSQLGEAKESLKFNCTNIYECIQLLPSHHAEIPGFEPEDFP
jgi:hypothetical protein